MNKCENDLYHGDEGRDWSESKSSKLRAANKAKFAASCKADLLKNPNYIERKTKCTQPAKNG
jgi:hypothetical protein